MESSCQQPDSQERFDAYLTTDHWRNVTQKVLERDEICEVCFTRLPEYAYPVTYRGFNTLGVCFAVECVGICSECRAKLCSIPHDPE